MSYQLCFYKPCPVTMKQVQNAEILSMEHEITQLEGSLWDDMYIDIFEIPRKDLEKEKAHRIKVCQRVIQWVEKDWIREALIRWSSEGYLNQVGVSSLHSIGLWLNRDKEILCETDSDEEGTPHWDIFRTTYDKEFFSFRDVLDSDRKGEILYEKVKGRKEVLDQVRHFFELYPKGVIHFG